LAEPVEYERRGEAFRAIHSALNDLSAPPPGKKITKLAFTWTAAGNIETMKAYDGVELLFTLTFTWNVDGTLNQVART